MLIQLIFLNESTGTAERSQHTRCRYMYSKTCVKRPLSKRPKLGFKTNYRLMQVKRFAECSKWSILQYFRPILSCTLLSRSLFCLFLSGHFTQVIRYTWHMRESKKGCKDQESIQSSITPDSGYQWECANVTIRHHKREPKCKPFPSR